MKECTQCEGTGELLESPCCGARYSKDYMICSDCKEHIGEEDIECEECNGTGTLNKQQIS